MAKTSKTIAVKRLVKAVKHSFLVKPKVDMVGNMVGRRRQGRVFL